MLKFVKPTLTEQENVPYSFWMPETYGPKRKDYPLSNLNDGLRLVRVRCAYCKRQHCYYPDDLIRIFGDVDVDSLAWRMKCENDAEHGHPQVEAFAPTGREAVGLVIRRLKALKVLTVPVWKEERR